MSEQCSQYLTDLLSGQAYFLKHFALGQNSGTLKKFIILQLRVLNEGESVEGSPVKVRALPDVARIMFSGIDPCAIGSIVEVLVRSLAILHINSKKDLDIGTIHKRWLSSHAVLDR